ncbi:MAG: PAS domain S-box protein, partial [Dehalococcoidales bacterium]|nr:PAS domain S-box protein [Dehalococcoidales bacterium]
EVRYRTLFESMVEGCALCQMIYDKKGRPVDYRILDANPMFEKYIGMRLRKIADKNIRSLFPHAKMKIIQRFGKVVRSGEPAHFENYSHDLKRWFEVRAYKTDPGYFALLVMDIHERKDTERKIHQLATAAHHEQERLKALVNSIPDEVWFADLQKTFTLANAAALKEFGNYAEGTGIESLANGLEVYRPDGTPRPVDEAPPLHALKGEVIKNQIEVVRTPGQPALRYRQVSAAPVKDAGGKIIGSVSVVRDITDTKEIEKALQASEARYRTTLESITNAFVSIDRQWRYTYVNDTACKILYKSREQLLGNVVWEVFPDSPAAFNAALHRSMKENTAVNFEVFYPQVNTWYQCQCYPSEQGLSVFFSDITARRKADEDLKETQRVLEEAQRIAHIGSWEWNVRTGDLHWSKELYAIYGADPDSFTPSMEQFAGFVHPEDREYLNGVMGQLMSGGQAANLDFRIILRDKTVRHVHATSEISLRDENGTPVIYVGTTQDITERKKVEEALKEAEVKASALIKYAPTGIYEINFRTERFLNINDAMTTLTGYTKEELFALGPAGLLDEESRTIFADRAKRQLAGEKLDETVEYRVKKKDGTILFVNLNVAFSKVNPGTVFVIGHDITERKRAEETLQETRDYLDNLLGYANAPIIVWNPAFRITRFNQAFERLTGRTAAEVLGRSLEFLFPASSREHSMEHIRRAAQGERMEVEEIPILHKDGTVRIVLWNSATIYDPDKKTPRATIAQGQDITARKQTENELKILNRELQVISQTNQAIEWATDELDFLKHVCSIVCEVAGYRMAWVGMVEQDEAKSIKPVAWGGAENGYLSNAAITWADTPRGRGPSGLAVRSGLPKFFTDFLSEPAAEPWRAAALARGYRSSISIPLLDENTSVFGVFSLYDAEPNGFTDSEVRLLQELALDISFGIRVLRTRKERAESEEKLRQRTNELEASNREIEAFSYSVSHDLRAPLRALDGFSHIVLEDYGHKLDDTAKDYLNRIRKASQDMSQLIDDMLKLSRITRADLYFDDVDISAIAQSIAGELRAAQPERQAEFTIMPQMVANVDRQLLTIALRNLLDNAWKFTSKCPVTRIEVGFTEQGGEKTYYIKDNGSGFDMAYADKIFRPFSRLHSEREFGGTGIGLAIVQRIIDRHGGRVWTEAAKGEGATFYFILKRRLDM